MKTKYQLYAQWKYCTSFLKRKWNLGDYPVVIRELKPDHRFDGTPRSQLRYAASIVNWGLTAGGDSKAEALQALERSFAMSRSERMAQGKPLPRPGTLVPVEFASQVRISAHAELAEDFVRRVLEREWVWLSDESSLWDFHGNTTNDPLIAKIEEVYGVDASDIQSAKVSEILDRIAAEGKNLPGRYLRRDSQLK